MTRAVVVSDHVLHHVVYRNQINSFCYGPQTSFFVLSHPVYIFYPRFIKRQRCRSVAVSGSYDISAQSFTYVSYPGCSLLYLCLFSPEFWLRFSPEFWSLSSDLAVCKIELLSLEFQNLTMISGLPLLPRVQSLCARSVSTLCQFCNSSLSSMYSQTFCSVSSHFSETLPLIPWKMRLFRLEWPWLLSSTLK